MTDRLRGVRCLAAASVLLVAPAPAAAQESKSSQLATELAKLLDERKLDSIAAKVEGDQYVGALYFPGSQLLVVKARYSVPQRMDAQLAAKKTMSIPGARATAANGASYVPMFRAIDFGGYAVCTLLLKPHHTEVFKC
jgi:hypothetical protein